MATEGSSYTIETELGSLADTTLTLYGPDGQQIAFDDDGGVGLASRIEFTADQSGAYRVDVAAYNGFQTGTYDLTVSAESIVPLPLPYPVDGVFAETEEEVSGIPIPLPYPAIVPVPLPYPVDGVFAEMGEEVSHVTVPIPYPADFADPADDVGTLYGWTY